MDEIVHGDNPFQNSIIVYLTDPFK